MFRRKYAEQGIDNLVRRIQEEGHADHTQSVIRYQALREAVDRFCPPDIHRDVMAYMEVAEGRLLERRR